MANKYLLGGFYIKLFSLIGLISCVALRTIVILQHYQPQWIKIAWYVGVCGYLVFFGFRYVISMKRKNFVRRYDLIRKINQQAPLTSEDQEVLEYLLLSIDKSKENINYLFIFSVSLVTIAVDVWLTLMAS